MPAVFAISAPVPRLDPSASAVARSLRPLGGDAPPAASRSADVVPLPPAVGAESLFGAAACRPSPEAPLA